MSLAIIGVMLVSSVAAQDAELWGQYEVTLEQHVHYENPFTDVTLSCTFMCRDEAVRVEGFYDGDNTWKARLMPTREGAWRYLTQSSDPELNGKAGSFTVGPPAEGNHGPVRVHNTHHFTYADGTPYIQIGTTCYAWAHQGDELEAQTLETLKAAPFNKMRMCVFPKAYTYNENEPIYYPFEGTPPREWDLARPNPEFWRHFETRVGDLMDLGIEADIIIFHPYDRWGFQHMDDASDDRYLRYLVARLAGYRNVWWSMANEFDLMKSKQPDDWDRYFRIVRDSDPYGHLRSVHNCRQWYDHTKPWVTHASIQTSQFGNTVELREKYGKPLVYDEVRYEGDVPQGWGNLTAQQLVNHFWLGATSGAYVGHGETYKHPHDILWWSKGGVLHGDSPTRIGFLRGLLEELPFARMEPDRDLSPGNYAIATPGEAYLVYFLTDAPARLSLPGNAAYRVDGIDPWEMTVTPLNDVDPGPLSFTPPKSRYALRLTAYREGQRRRPRAVAQVEPAEGVPPLRVSLTGPGDMTCKWDFGDGAKGVGRHVAHTYDEPGLYIAKLTVTDEAGQSSTALTPVAVDFPDTGPLVRAGFAEGETHELTLNGGATRGEDGSIVMGEGEPWDWVAVGAEPNADLEGLRSFTVLGWARATSRETGSGGNRIACNLNYNRAGVDLVVLNDGRLRLAVNEWPDGARNDTPPNALPLDEWTFFAVTYDSTKADGAVRWYIGSARMPVELVAITDYNRGATGQGSKLLTLGNYNPPLHRHGLDRQFRGALRGVEVFGSRVSGKGALGPVEIARRHSLALPR